MLCGSDIGIADGLRLILCIGGEDIHSVLEAGVAGWADSTWHRYSKRKVIWIYVGDGGVVCNCICKAWCMLSATHLQS